VVVVFVFPISLRLLLLLSTSQHLLHLQLLQHSHFLPAQDQRPKTKEEKRALGRMKEGKEGKDPFYYPPILLMINEFYDLCVFKMCILNTK
jgi:hypothetical protein